MREPASARSVCHGRLPARSLAGKMTIPNTFFHVAMAYAVLRHNGVDIGKMDFLGPVNWIDA